MDKIPATSTLLMQADDRIKLAVMSVPERLMEYYLDYDITCRYNWYEGTEDSVFTFVKSEDCSHVFTITGKNDEWIPLAIADYNENCEVSGALLDGYLMRTLHSVVQRKLDELGVIAE